MKTRTTSTLALIALALTTTTGCFGDATKAKVVGVVIVDGVKAEEGAVTFVPVDGMSPTAGTNIKNGSYSAMVPFGKMKVEIRVPKKVGERKKYDSDDSPVETRFVESLPRKYNAETELVVEVVQGGENVFDFPLSTKEENP